MQSIDPVRRKCKTGIEDHLCIEALAVVFNGREAKAVWAGTLDYLLTFEVAS